MYLAINTYKTIFCQNLLAAPLKCCKWFYKLYYYYYYYYYYYSNRKHVL